MGSGGEVPKRGPGGHFKTKRLPTLWPPKNQRCESVWNGAKKGKPRGVWGQQSNGSGRPGRLNADVGGVRGGKGAIRKALGANLSGEIERQEQGGYQNGSLQ